MRFIKENGISFTNYQVRSNSTDEVARVLKDVVRTKAYVSPSKNGWITVYDEMSDEEMDYYELHHISQKLSSSLSTVVFVFFVYRSSYLIYFLYDLGELVDEYHSEPEGFRFGFELVNDSILDRFRGNPQIVWKYCIIGTKL
ncbi:hypothetical protein [Scytonema sp. NUACC26]|uniref:hypothetical protein n=1 Tax=Scytonema sp. NUACC26 TaxID=3140176 RepID=UPI0034DBDE78